VILFLHIGLTQSENVNISRFAFENVTLVTTQKFVGNGVSDELQTQLFQIFPFLYESSNKLCVNPLGLIIQKCGQVLSSAWKIVLPILQSAIQGDIENIQIAFKSVQYIGNEFLTLLDMKEYIKTVG
jgi:hypothetical protein